MTGPQIQDAVFGAKKTQPDDPRPFWKRLLSSLRVVIKPGKTARKPVSYIGVKAEADL